MTHGSQQGRIHPALAVLLAIVAVILLIMLTRGCVQGGSSKAVQKPGATLYPVLVVAPPTHCPSESLMS